jgi:surface antigen/LysM repeat protein
MIATPKSKLARPSLFKTPTLRKAARRRLLRLSLVGGNILLFAGVLYLVIAPSHSSANAPQVAATANAASTQEVSALDQLASASIAQSVADMTGVAELIPITNQADSERLNLNQASLDDSLLANKPQAIESAYKSNKDIKTYTVQSGDTIAKIATKFGITSDSIRWSNSLGSGEPNVGKKLLIPPVNGIIYKVKGGDTPASLASKYDIANAKIVAYNDAELHGLTVGELIILPDASLASQTRRFSSSSYASSYSSYRYRPVYGYNGYDYGYCTWYVATRISNPANWGSAYSWDTGARETPGFRVDSTPTPGSILQDDGSLYGMYHVAYVESVTATSVTVAEMNVRAHGGGWGSVDRWTWSRDQLRSHGTEFIHKL